GIRFFVIEQQDSPEIAPQSPIQAPPIPQDEDERDPMFIQLPDPDYVLEPIHPDRIPREDPRVLRMRARGCGRLTIYERGARMMEDVTQRIWMRTYHQSEDDSPQTSKMQDERRMRRN
ncbi:hypothetical protein Tco_0866923, partial [Tanacetum coccineum]